MIDTPDAIVGAAFDADELARLKVMFERSPSFICLLEGPEHRFIMVNPAYQQLIGHRDFIGMVVREAVPDAGGQGFFELLDQVFTSGESFAAQNTPLVVQKTPGGPLEIRILDFVYQPIRNMAGNVTSIFVEGVDVTERHAVQRAFTQTEARLQKINDDVEQEVLARNKTRSLTWTLSPDLLGALNAEGYFETANPAWKTILGWEEHEVLGMSIFELLHPDDVEHTRAGFDLTQIGQPALKFANRYRSKDGYYRWISWVGIPEDGFVYCTGRDITAERDAEAELAAAQESLRQTAKMETIGQLSGGIAHDFNNHLASILGAINLCHRRINAGRTHDLSELLNAASTSAHKAAQLTHRLLAFARRQPLDEKPNDVNNLIKTMEEMLRRSLGEKIRLQCDYAPDLWPALCDGNQLENALLNLVINGRDAMPDGGRLIVQTQNLRLDADGPNTSDLKHGDYVSLSVTDSGIGMSPELLAKVAEPFFTTKPIGEGTGLGLSMILGFAKQSGGHMQIESQLGRGTTVHLYLPRAHHPAVVVEHHTKVAPSGKGEIILLVEDDASVRVIVAQIIEDLGYIVRVCADSRTAIMELQSDQHVDLMISDVVLPHVSGPKLAEVGRELRSDLKILFITGYADLVTGGAKFVGEGMDLLPKPFTVDSLGLKIRELLDT